MASDTSARDRLLRSGADLFAEKGFAGVSVRAICDHAGTSNNMVHHYFGSKQGLLDAIVEQYGEQVLRLPMVLLDTPADSAADFVRRMEMVFATTLEAYIENRSLMVVTVREQLEPRDLRTYVQRLTTFLDEAKESGFVRKELDVEMLTGAMLDRLINYVLFAPWMKRSQGIDTAADAKYRKRWCRANMDLFLNGMLVHGD